VGLLLFVVPGLILLLRWIVAAQAAAIEDEGWSTALRRSEQLSAGRYRHVLLFFVFTSLIAGAPGFLGAHLFGYHDTTAASALTGLVVHVVTASFSALAMALLFYDLLVRREGEAREFAAREPVAADATGPLAPGAAHRPPVSPLPLDPARDPRRYADADRPHGWYVDPDSPKRMRYWRNDAPRGWEGKARTPREVRQFWPDL
jgi:hypothetical protein